MPTVAVDTERSKRADGVPATGRTEPDRIHVSFAATSPCGHFCGVAFLSPMTWPERTLLAMPPNGKRTRSTTVVSTTLLVCALAALLPTTAGASPAVTMNPDSPGNRQTITVSGTGFPVHSKIPTGIQIIECADPGGTVANLPTSALLCDGTTQNPSQINTDANGNFSTKYQVFTLNGAHTSNIWCDKSHYCVLWAGVDYNGDFYGVHAFSTPFRVGVVGSSGGSGSGVWIVVVVVVVVVGGLVALRMRARRRMASSTP